MYAVGNDVYITVVENGAQLEVKAQTVDGLDLGTILFFTSDGKVNRQFLSGAAQAFFTADVSGKIEDLG